MSEQESYSSIVTRLASERREKERIEIEENERITAEKLEAYRARLAPITDMVKELTENVKKVKSYCNLIPTHLQESPTFKVVCGYSNECYFRVKEASDGYRLEISGYRGWKSPVYPKITDLIPVILGKVAELI